MKNVVVLGAAGFLGSHLCDRLIDGGDSVIGVDNLSTSTGQNLVHLRDHPRFTFAKSDICSGVEVSEPVDFIFNLASPASPPRYQELPIETLRVGSIGTEQAINLALVKGARLVMASTSEVYGDPAVSPQHESYWGHVNPNGLRSCYDEAKRYAEALCMAYHRVHGLNVGIARIFNTYGPRLDPNDGRVVSNFIVQALRGEDLTVYGDGSQTRSFCYVSDQVTGLLALASSDVVDPVNIGNPVEYTMNQLAERIVTLVGSGSEVRHDPLPADDPMQRCPDISRARSLFGWEPIVPLDEGLAATIDWFRDTVIDR